LQKHQSRIHPVAFAFTADDCSGLNTKFQLFFHQQNEQSGTGMIVDIRSLAYDTFLDGKGSHYIQPNSRTAPGNKFLIIPVFDG
jgi:hypothetical protein